MASPTQDIATAWTIVYGTSNYTALLKNLSIPEISCNDIETSYQGTSGGTDFTKPTRTYVPSDFIEGGEFTAEYYYNPDLIPPIGQKQQVTLTSPGGATMVFQGYMKSIGGDPLTLDEVMMITATTKIAGPVEITAGS